MAGSSADNFKQFLYVFCGKNKVQPAYTYEEEETGFYCEVKKHLRPSKCQYWNKFYRSGSKDTSS